MRTPQIQQQGKSGYAVLRYPQGVFFLKQLKRGFIRLCESVRKSLLMEKLICDSVFRQVFSKVAGSTYKHLR